EGGGEDTRLPTATGSSRGGARWLMAVERRLPWWFGGCHGGLARGGVGYGGLGVGRGSVCCHGGHGGGEAAAAAIVRCGGGGYGYGGSGGDVGCGVGGGGAWCCMSWIG
nr:hypothetical protein [Tanacetum cinerariifolium]GFB12983.1 hypothetical protein [Tanacetum cinerariifolium]